MAFGYKNGKGNASKKFIVSAVAVRMASSQQKDEAVTRKIDAMRLRMVGSSAKFGM